MKYQDYEKAFSPARLYKYLKAFGGDTVAECLKPIPRRLLSRRLSVPWWRKIATPMTGWYHLWPLASGLTCLPRSLLLQAGKACCRSSRQRPRPWTESRLQRTSSHQGFSQQHRPSRGHLLWRYRSQEHAAGKGQLRYGPQVREIPRLSWESPVLWAGCPAGQDSAEDRYALTYGIQKLTTPDTWRNWLRYLVFVSSRI